MRLPDESRAELDREEAAWRLLAPWDVTPANATLERHAVYTFQARWVEQWRRGSVLLAGDAAHQMPPFAGQGMCSGLRDAANLAWKLDLVLRGEAGGALLDAYGEERGPQVAAVIRTSIELGEIICVPDAAQAADRDALMTAARPEDSVTEQPPLPGLAGGVRHPTSPHAGELFVQGDVAVGGRRLRFDDHAGAGWRLVARPDAVPSLAPDLAAWFARIGGRIVVVVDRGAGDGAHGDLVAVDEPDGTYGAWFAAHEVVAALQRPDFHLYGTAADAPGVVDLLGHLRATLDPAAARADRAPEVLRP